MTGAATSPYVVALTGGIASGKSELARRFAAFGVEIVDADAIARDVVAPGTEGLAAVARHFGDDVLAVDGSLDRAALRRRVFDDADARRALESIVHPRVRATIEARCRAAGGPYVVADIPLLAEGGARAAYPYLARVLVVDVPVAVQRERLMARDGVDAALADRMIAAQATRAQRLAIADDVVENSGDRSALDAAAAALDRRYRQLASS